MWPARPCDRPRTVNVQPRRDRPRFLNVRPTRRIAAPVGEVRNTGRQRSADLLDVVEEWTQDREPDNDGESEHRLENNHQQPNFEDDRDVPTVDEYMQQVGADTFDRFERQIKKLDNERGIWEVLWGVLSSSFRLRERLPSVLYLFGNNAADLFPRKVQKKDRDPSLRPRIRRPRKKKGPTQILDPMLKEETDVPNFPQQLEGFAEDMIIFLDCLNDFPEFTDENINASIIALEGDLKYWASCLKTYKRQFKDLAVRRYLHQLTAEIGEHLDSIIASLDEFTRIGVPAIRNAQKDAAANILNLSTVATFFSAVTATTMQFSFQQVGNPLADSVNGFWFTSLVFSIGAAVISLLGVTWKQAMFRSPGHRVPWWVLMWIKRSPSVLLVLSAACFSMGLVLFAYSSGQHRITCAITTVFMAFICFGLTSVFFWFASERRTFTRHRGQKWLADVLSETRMRPSKVLGIAWCIHQLRQVAQQWGSKIRFTYRDVKDRIHRIMKLVKKCRSQRVQQQEDLESANDDERKSPVVHRYSLESVSPTNGHRPSSATSSDSIPKPVPPPCDGEETTVVSDPGTSDPKPVPSHSRITALVHKLKVMDVTFDMAAHVAFIRHIQFSPDGKFLATSSWDGTSMIFSVEGKYESHCVLEHTAGFVGQVAWSPNSKVLLCKMADEIEVWTGEGVCKMTINRRHPVHSVAWFPHGEAFLSVEQRTVMKLDLNGQVLASYHLDQINVFAVSVAQDSQRMLCVGELLVSPTGLKPKKTRAEKQILIYNLDKKEIESRVPVLHDVHDITLTRPIQGQEQVALVSYENKAPPQLWKIEISSKASTVRLSLRHTYMPKTPVDFAGPSFFGGKNDQLVLCAGKSGDIHIWDRDSGSLLHYIRPRAIGGDMTCAAWNHTSDSFMFATGCHDGAVKIWTSPGQVVEDPTPSRSTTHPSSIPRSNPPSFFEANHLPDTSTAVAESNNRHGQSRAQDYSRHDHGKTVVFMQSP